VCYQGSKIAQQISGKCHQLLWLLRQCVAVGIWLVQHFSLLETDSKANSHTHTHTHTHSRRRQNAKRGLTNSLKFWAAINSIVCAVPTEIGFAYWTCMFVCCVEDLLPNSNIKLDNNFKFSFIYDLLTVCTCRHFASVYRLSAVAIKLEFCLFLAIHIIVFIHCCWQYK